MDEERVTKKIGEICDILVKTNRFKIERSDSSSSYCKVIKPAGKEEVGIEIYATGNKICVELDCNSYDTGSDIILSLPLFKALERTILEEMHENGVLRDIITKGDFKRLKFNPAGGYTPSYGGRISTGNRLTEKEKRLVMETSAVAIVYHNIINSKVYKEELKSCMETIANNINLSLERVALNYLRK